MSVEVERRVRQLQQRVADSRRRHVSLDLALRVGEHDRRLAGSLLAAALAFRVFLYLLPLSVVVVAGLGFLRPHDLHHGASSFGISNYVAAQITDAATSAHRARWFALVFGLVLLALASNALVRAAFTAAALAWNLPDRRPARRAVAAVALNVVVAAALLADAAVVWLRHRSAGIGLASLLATVVVWTLLWLAVSFVLPRRPETTLVDLVPGAVLFGVGIYALHLATVLYLGHRIATASKWYGALGGAATLLLWALLMCRLATASLSVNATWWAHRRTRRRPTDPVPDDPHHPVPHR